MLRTCNVKLILLPLTRPMRGAVRNKRRGIIISQSTYAGSGLYAGHGLGDNSASWTDMRLSIVGELPFNRHWLHAMSCLCAIIQRETKMFDISTICLTILTSGRDVELTIQIVP